MKEEEDTVVVVSSDSEEDESSVWIKKCKNKQFQNLWNKVQPILFHHVLPEYKSSYFPYEKFKELAEDLRKSLTLVYVDSTQAFIWKNCIRWLVSMKLCYEGISDLKYDERYNLILTDYMSQYMNYKCNLYSTITDETEVRRRVDEILVTMGIVFSGNIPSILMTLLKIEVKDVYRLILDPIFRKYLSNKNFHEPNELISYLRLILCYRQWKRLFHFKEQKELINEIAVGKSDKFFRSSSQQMSIDLTAREAVLPKTVPKFNETNQSFAAISGLIRIAMEEPYGTRTLLIRKSLDLDETIVRYFQKYERHICQSESILCESTKALRIFDDVSNISRCTSPVPQPMVIQDLKRSPSRNESLLDAPTLTAEPESQRRTNKEAQQGLNIVNNIDKQGTKAVNQHLSMDCDISRISNAFNFSNLSRNEQELSLSIKKKIQNSSSDVKVGILSNNMGSVIELDTTDGEDDDDDDNVKNGSKNDDKKDTTVVDEAQRNKDCSPSLRRSFLEKLQQRAVVIGSNSSLRRSKSPIVLSSSSDEDDVEPVVHIRQVGCRNVSLLNRTPTQQRADAEQNHVPEGVNRPSDERRKQRCITGEVSSTTSLDYSTNHDVESSAISQIAGLENAREVGTLSAVRTSPRCGSILANNDYSDISEDEAGPSSLITGRQVSGLRSKFSKVVEEATSSTSEMWVGGDVPSENVVFSMQPTRALRSTSSSPCITRTSSPIDNITNNFPSSTIRLSRMRSGLIVQPQLTSVSRITVRRLNSLTAADDVAMATHSRSREQPAPVPICGNNSIDRQKEIHEHLNRSNGAPVANITQDDEVPTCSRYIATSTPRVNSDESSRTDIQHSHLGIPKMIIGTKYEKKSKATPTADKEALISLKPASPPAQNNTNVVHHFIDKELPVDESDNLVDLDKFLNDISDHIGETSQRQSGQIIDKHSCLSSSKESITKPPSSKNSEKTPAAWQHKNLLKNQPQNRNPNESKNISPNAKFQLSNAEVSQDQQSVDTGQVKDANVLKKNTSQQKFVEIALEVGSYCSPISPSLGNDDVPANEVQEEKLTFSKNRNDCQLTEKKCCNSTQLLQDVKLKDFVLKKSESLNQSCLQPQEPISNEIIALNRKELCKPLDIAESLNHIDPNFVTNVALSELPKVKSTVESCLDTLKNKENENRHHDLLADNVIDTEEIDICSPLIDEELSNQSDDIESPAYEPVGPVKTNTNEDLVEVSSNVNAFQQSIISEIDNAHKIEETSSANAKLSLTQNIEDETENIEHENEKNVSIQCSDHDDCLKDSKDEDQKAMDTTELNDEDIFEFYIKEDDIVEANNCKESEIATNVSVDGRLVDPESGKCSDNNDTKQIVLEDHIIAVPEAQELNKEENDVSEDRVFETTSKVDENLNCAHQLAAEVEPILGQNQNQPVADLPICLSEISSAMVKELPVRDHIPSENSVEQPPSYEENKNEHMFKEGELKADEFLGVEIEREKIEASNNIMNTVDDFKPEVRGIKEKQENNYSESAQQADDKEIESTKQLEFMPEENSMDKCVQAGDNKLLKSVNEANYCSIAIEEASSYIFKEKNQPEANETSILKNKIEKEKTEEHVGKIDICKEIGVSTVSKISDERTTTEKCSNTEMLVVVEHSITDNCAEVTTVKEIIDLNPVDKETTDSTQMEKSVKPPPIDTMTMILNNVEKSEPTKNAVEGSCCIGLRLIETTKALDEPSSVDPGANESMFVKNKNPIVVQNDEMNVIQEDVTRDLVPVANTKVLDNKTDEIKQGEVFAPIGKYQNEQTEIRKANSEDKEVLVSKPLVEQQLKESDAKIEISSKDTRAKEDRNIEINFDRKDTNEQTNDSKSTEKRENPNPNISSELVAINTKRSSASKTSNHENIEALMSKNLQVLSVVIKTSSFEKEAIKMDILNSSRTESPEDSVIVEEDLVLCSINGNTCIDLPPGDKSLKKEGNYNNATSTSKSVESNDKYVSTKSTDIIEDGPTSTNSIKTIHEDKPFTQLNSHRKEPNPNCNVVSKKQELSTEIANELSFNVRSSFEQFNAESKNVSCEKITNSESRENPCLYDSWSNEVEVPLGIKLRADEDISNEDDSNLSTQVQITEEDLGDPLLSFDSETCENHSMYQDNFDTLVRIGPEQYDGNKETTLLDSVNRTEDEEVSEITSQECQSIAYNSFHEDCGTPVLDEKNAEEIESPTIQPKVISLSVLKENSKLENQVISIEPPTILTFSNQIEPQAVSVVLPKVGISHTQISEEKAKSALSPVTVCSAESKVTVTPTNTTSQFIEPSPKSKQATETDTVYQRTPLKIRMKRRISQCGDDFNLGSNEPISSISKIPMKGTYEEPIINYFENTHPKFDQLSGNSPLDLVIHSERDSIDLDASVHTPNKNTPVLNEEDQNLRYKESWFKKLGISKTTHKPFSKELLSPTVTQPYTSSFSAFAELPTSPNLPKNASVIGKNVGRRKKPRRVKKLTGKSDVISDDFPVANLTCPIVPLNVTPHLSLAIIEPNIPLLQSQTIIQSSVDTLSKQIPTTEHTYNPEDIKAATILSDMLKKSNKTEESLINEPQKGIKAQKSRKPKNAGETPAQFTRLTRSTSQLVEKPPASDTDITPPSKQECKEVKRSTKKKAIISCTESIWQPEKTKEILRSITDQKTQNSELLDECPILSKCKDFKKHLNCSSDSDNSGRLVIDLDEKKNCKSKQKHKTKMTKNNRRKGSAKIGLEKKITELLHKANVKAGMKEEICPPVVKYDENILLSPHNVFKLTPEVDVFFSNMQHLDSSPKECKRSTNMNSTSEHYASEDEVSQFYPIVQLTEDVALTPKTRKRCRKRRTKIIREQSVNKPEESDSTSKPRSSSKSKSKSKLTDKCRIKPEFQFERKRNSETSKEQIDTAKVAPSQKSSSHENLLDKKSNKKALDDTVSTSEPNQGARSKQRLSFSIDVILGNQEEEPQLSKDESPSPHITMNKEMWLTTFSLQKNEIVKELPKSKPKAYEMIKSSSDTCLNSRKDHSISRKMSTEQILLEDLKSSLSLCEVIDAGQVRKRRKSLVTMKLMTSNSTQKEQDKVYHDANVLMKQERLCKSRRKSRRSSVKIVIDEPAKDAAENGNISESDEKISKLISAATRKPKDQLFEQRKSKSDDTDISKLNKSIPTLSQKKLDMSRAVQSNKASVATTGEMKSKLNAQTLSLQSADEYDRPVWKGQCDAIEIAKSEKSTEFTRKKKESSKSINVTKTKDETEVQLNSKPSGNKLAIYKEPQGAKLDGNEFLSSETSATKIVSAKPSISDAEALIKIGSLEKGKCYDGETLKLEPSVEKFVVEQLDDTSTFESQEPVDPKSLEKGKHDVDGIPVAKLVPEKADDTIAIESQEQVKLKFHRKGKRDAAEMLATKVVSGKPNVTNTIHAQQRPEFKSTGKGPFDESKVPTSETNVKSVVVDSIIEPQGQLEAKALGTCDTSELDTLEKADVINSLETQEELNSKYINKRKCDSTVILNLETTDTKLVPKKVIAKCLTETRKPHKFKSLEKGKPNTTKIPHSETSAIKLSGKPDVESSIDKQEKLNLKSILKGNCHTSSLEKANDTKIIKSRKQVKFKSLGKGKGEVTYSEKPATAIVPEVGKGNTTEINYSEMPAIKHSGNPDVKSTIRLQEKLNLKSIVKGDCDASQIAKFEISNAKLASEKSDDISTIEAQEQVELKSFGKEREADVKASISGESAAKFTSEKTINTNIVKLREQGKSKSLGKEKREIRPETPAAAFVLEELCVTSTAEAQENITCGSIKHDHIEVSKSETFAAEYDTGEKDTSPNEQAASKSRGKEKRDTESSKSEAVNLVLEQADAISVTESREQGKSKSIGKRNRDESENSFTLDKEHNASTIKPQKRGKSKSLEKDELDAAKVTISEVSTTKLVLKKAEFIDLREQVQLKSHGDETEIFDSAKFTSEKSYGKIIIEAQEHVKAKHSKKGKRYTTGVLKSEGSTVNLILEKADNALTVSPNDQLKTKSFEEVISDAAQIPETEMFAEKLDQRKQNVANKFETNETQKESKEHVKLHSATWATVTSAGFGEKERSANTVGSKKILPNDEVLICKNAMDDNSVTNQHKECLVRNESEKYATSQIQDIADKIDDSLGKILNIGDSNGTTQPPTEKQDNSSKISAKNESNKSFDKVLTCVGSLEKTELPEEISGEIKLSDISSPITNKGGEQVKRKSFDKEEPMHNAGTVQPYNKQHDAYLGGDDESSLKYNSDKEVLPEPLIVGKQTSETNLNDLCNKDMVEISSKQEPILDETKQTSTELKQLEFVVGADEAKETTTIGKEEKSQLDAFKQADASNIVITFNTSKDNESKEVTDSVLSQKKSVEKSIADGDWKVEEGSSHSLVSHKAKENQVFDSERSQDLLGNAQSALELKETNRQSCKGQQIKFDIDTIEIKSVEHDSERIRQSQNVQQQTENPSKLNIDSPTLALQVVEVTKIINNTAIKTDISADPEKLAYAAKDLKIGNVSVVDIPKEKSSKFKNNVTPINTLLDTVKLAEQPASLTSNNKTDLKLNSLNTKDIIGKINKSKLMIKIRRFDFNNLKTKNHSKTRKKLKKGSKNKTKRGKTRTLLVSKISEKDDLTTPQANFSHAAASTDAEVCNHTELTNEAKNCVVVDVPEDNLPGECDSFEKRQPKNQTNEANVDILKLADISLSVNSKTDKSLSLSGLNKNKIDTTYEDFGKTHRLELLETVERTLGSSFIQTREPCEVPQVDSKTTQHSVSTLVDEGNAVMILEESSSVIETINDQKELKANLVSCTPEKNVTQSRSGAENVQHIKLAPIIEVTEDLEKHKLDDCAVESAVSNSKSLCKQAITNLSISKVSDADEKTKINKYEDLTTLSHTEKTSCEDKVFPSKSDLMNQLKHKRLSIDHVRSRLDIPTSIRKRSHSVEEYKFICDETPNKRNKITLTLTNSNAYKVLIDEKKYTSMQLDSTKHQLNRKQSLESSSISLRKRRFSADMLEEIQHKKIKVSPLNLNVTKSQIDSIKEAENCLASPVSTGVEHKPKDEVEIVAEQLELSIKNILGNKLSESEVESSPCGMSKIILTNRPRGFDSVPDDIFAGNGDPSESIETKFYPAILKPGDLMLKATQAEEASEIESRLEGSDTQSSHKSCGSVGGNGAENQPNTGNSEGNSAPDLELDTFPMTSISDINVIGNSSIFEDSCIPDFIVQNDCLEDVLDGIIDLTPFSSDCMISGSYGDEFDNDIPLYMLEPPLVFLENEGMSNVNRFDARRQAPKRNIVAESFSASKNEVSTDDEIDFENELFTYPGLVSIQSRESSTITSEKNLPPCVTVTQEKPAVITIETLFESKPAQKDDSMFKKPNSLQISTEDPVTVVPQEGVPTYYVPPVEVSTEVGFESYDELLADNTQFFPASDLEKDKKQEQLSKENSIKEAADADVTNPVVNVETSVSEATYNIEPTSCPAALVDIKGSSQEVHQMSILKISDIGLDAKQAKTDVTKKQEKSTTKKQEKETTKTCPDRKTKIDMLMAKAKSATPIIPVHDDITSPPKLKTRPNRFWGKKVNKSKSPLQQKPEIIIEEQSAKPKSNVDGCSDSAGTIESTKHIETFLDLDLNVSESKSSSMTEAISTSSSANAVQEEISFAVNLGVSGESKLNVSPKNMPQLDELIEDVSSAVPLKPLPQLDKEVEGKRTMKSNVTLKDQPSKKPCIEAVAKLSTDDVFDWLKRGPPVNPLIEKLKPSLKKSSSFGMNEASSMDSSIQPLVTPISPDANSVDKIPPPTTSHVSKPPSLSSPKILSMPVVLPVPKEESSPKVEPINDCSKQIPENKNISSVKAVTSSSKCDTRIDLPVLSSVTTKCNSSQSDVKTKIEVSCNSSKSGNLENSIPPKVDILINSITKSNSSDSKPITTPLSTTSKHKNSEKISTRTSSPVEVHKLPSSSKINTKLLTPGVSSSPRVTNLPELNPFAIKPIPLPKSVSESPFQPQKPLKSILKSPSIPSSSRPNMDSPSLSQKSIKSIPSSKQLSFKLNSPFISQRPPKSIPSPSKCSSSKKEIATSSYSPKFAKHVPTPPQAVSFTPAIVSKRTPKNPMPAPIPSSSRHSASDHITTIASLTAEINALSEELQELPERAGTYIAHKKRKSVLEIHEQKLKKLEELKKLHLEEAARNRVSFSKLRSHSERQPTDKHADHRLAVHRSQRDLHKEKPKESRQAYVNKFWQLKNKSFENIDRSDHKGNTIEKSKVLPSWEWKPASTEEIIADLKTSRRN